MANEFSDDTLLARWLDGTLSETELQELQARPDFADFQQLATVSKELKVPNYDAAAELLRLQERQQAMKAKAKQPPASGLRALRAVHYWSAAVAAVLLLIAWAVWPGSVQEIHAEAGTPISTSNLEDGSVLKLNADSYFAFSMGEQRLGKLEGEGFFSVEKSDIPFVVETEVGSVTVLGTSFNVYARDGTLSVACVTGRVRVAFAGSGDPVELTPGEAVLKTTGGIIRKSATDEEQALDWLNGESVFKSQPLEAIVAELERQFNLTVNFPAGFDTNATYSVSFSNTDLNLALAKVFDPLEGITFKQVGQTITVTSPPN